MSCHSLYPLTPLKNRVKGLRNTNFGSQDKRIPHLLKNWFNVSISLVLKGYLKLQLTFSHRRENTTICPVLDAYPLAQDTHWVWECFPSLDNIPQTSRSNIKSQCSVSKFGFLAECLRACTKYTHYKYTRYLYQEYYITVQSFLTFLLLCTFSGSVLCIVYNVKCITMSHFLSVSSGAPGFFSGVGLPLKQEDADLLSSYVANSWW